MTAREADVRIWQDSSPKIRREAYETIRQKADIKILPDASDIIWWVALERAKQ